MSTETLIVMAKALSRWLATQEFEKANRERLTALEAQGLKFSPEDLSTYAREA